MEYQRLRMVEDDANEIRESDCVDVNTILIEIRKEREFKGKAFFLSDIYNWHLGRDNWGCTILVPTKK